MPCPACAVSYQQVSLQKSSYEISTLGGLDHARLRFMNESGCDSCIKGIIGQTLVAEVHPYTLDDGKVYEIITAKAFHLLTDYMCREHHVMSKAAHAREKMNRGEIDPFATMRIIGNFRAEKWAV